MALSIKNPEADDLARELAARTGTGLTEAVLLALREQLRRTPRTQEADLATELLAIGARCSALPVLDPRTAEEILDDEAGEWP